MVARGEKTLNSSILGVRENCFLALDSYGDDLEYALIRLAASAVLTLEAIRKGERI